jgi:thiosulfate/3-mercaptopyruvate sulfurtransferase
MSALPPLVSADELAAVLGAPSLVVLDATTRLTVTGEGVAYTVIPDRDGFAAAHVPGARFVDVQGDLSGPAGRFAFALPSPEAFAAAMSRLGVGDGTHVVAYDTGRTAWATRVWWMLRTFGHDAVSVLDGGLRAWQAGGHPIETGEAREAVSATFTPRFREELVAHLPEVAAASTGGGTPLFNALDAATFRGDNEVSPYSRRGRIPGSRNLPGHDLLDPSTGRFLDRDALAARLQASGILDAGRAIAYCGGGIAATLPAFAAYLVSGIEVAIYDGSLSEWTADLSLPVELG